MLFVCLFAYVACLLSDVLLVVRCASVDVLCVVCYPMVIVNCSVHGVS